MQLSESEGSDDNDDTTAKDSRNKDGSFAKTYVPPRFAPMHYGREWLSLLNLIPVFTKNIGMERLLVLGFDTVKCLFFIYFL